MNEQILTDLYLRLTGTKPQKITRIIGSGSARAYYRLSGSINLIGTIGTNIDENRAFIYLDRHFRDKGLNVPEIVAVSDNSSAYLQSDLGDMSLFKLIIRDGADDDNVRGLLRETISRLPDLQFKGSDNLDFTRCFPVEKLDRRSIMWDLNYFKYCFLRLSGVEFDEAGLDDDFNKLADMITDDPVQAFMYRDFQSRNVMIHGGGPWFIDFQGGRHGPVLYDLASFLYQARAGFSTELRSELAGVYLESARRYHSFDSDEFHHRLWVCTLFRTIQVLGAYGLRGLHEQKAHFVESIPMAVANLHALSEGMENDFPTLSAVVKTICSLDAYRHHKEPERLVVEVNSFGFRASGIPRDMTGNGGGFVFDCRVLTNPGRYAEYMPLTGMDRAVIDFLETDGEVLTFLNHAKQLVKLSVERYLERDFKHLTVSFGCTGGRHRSVYCAESMARWISEELGVDVNLHHREQHIERHITGNRQ